MNDKLIGSIFILVSGVMYTIERSVSWLVWVAQKTAVAIHGSGEWPTEPTLPSITDNLFVLLFLVIGIVMLYKDRVKGGNGG